MNGIIIVPLVILAATAFAYGVVQREKRRVAERYMRIWERVAMSLAGIEEGDVCDSENKADTAGG